MDFDLVRYDWVQVESHKWTDKEFRAPIIAFLETMVAGHNWMHAWLVTERFHDNAINVKKPFGEYHDVDRPRTIREGFLQRDGIPILLIGLGDPSYNITLEFPKGVLTSPQDVDNLLTIAQQSLRAQKAATL